MTALPRRALLVASTAAAAAQAFAWRADAASAQATDVASFGAKGDGVTDDAPAIQAACDSGAAVVRFPPGRYLVRRPLIPRSHQSWIGAGPDLSTLAFPAENLPEPFNLIHHIGLLEAFSLTSLGLEGNIGSQTTVSRDGQTSFAVYIRGQVRRISIIGCRIAHFGDGGPKGSAKSGGGGVILGPGPHQPLQALEDIVVAQCRFDGNGNVPGVYISGGHIPGEIRANLRIEGNRFSGVAPGSRPQNCVYILSDSAETRIRNVVVIGNQFDVRTDVDAMLELNWVQGFVIANNSFRFAGALPESTSILVRDGVRSGSIAGNSFVNETSERVAGVVLVNFAHPGTIEDVTITGNSIQGYGWRGISVDRGSRGVVVSANRISGDPRIMAEGIRVVDAKNVLVVGNLLSRIARPIQLGAGEGPHAGLAAVAIRGNLIVDCGGFGPLIEDGLAAAVEVALIDNEVRDSRPGTSGLVSHALANGGARLAGNHHPDLAASAPAP
ncbi:MAG: glycosyl hydrolase family 28-related protein [Elsteraceae bacterium]